MISVHDILLFLLVYVVDEVVCPVSFFVADLLSV